MRDKLAALLLGFLLNLMPLGQILAHVLDQEMSCREGQYDAYTIAHITAVAWQIGNKFNEENEYSCEHKAA